MIVDIFSQSERRIHNDQLQRSNRDGRFKFMYVGHGNLRFANVIVAVRRSRTVQTVLPDTLFYIIMIVTRQENSSKIEIDLRAAWRQRGMEVKM